MKRAASALLLLALCSGCTSYTYKGVSVRTFLTRGSIESVEFIDPAGVTLRVNGYTKDEVSGIEAIVRAAAEGAASGAAP